MNGLQKCEDKPSLETKLCCVVETNLNNVAGLSFGSILGGTAGSAAASVFDVTNRSAGGGLMPSANAGCDNLPVTGW